MTQGSTIKGCTTSHYFGFGFHSRTCHQLLVVSRASRAFLRVLWFFSCCKNESFFFPGSLSYANAVAVPSLLNTSWQELNKFGGKLRYITNIYKKTFRNQFLRCFSICLLKYCDCLLQVDHDFMKHCRLLSDAGYVINCTVIPL